MSLRHGKEWKNQFKTLLMPMLSKDVFPLGILINLEQYAQNPKASTCSDHELLESLHQFNKIISKDPSQVLLKNLIGKVKVFNMPLLVIVAEP